MSAAYAEWRTGEAARICCDDRPGPNDQTSKIATTDLEKADTVVVGNIDGNYPDYQNIIPSTEKGYIKSILDINKLKQVIDVISKMDLPDNGNIEVLTVDQKENKPMIIKGITKDNQQVVGLVMPINDNNDGGQK